MNNKDIINRTVDHVKKKLYGEGSGHDWWHIYRVWKNSIQIGSKESADMFVIELSALLHDIADWKFYNGDDSIGPKIAEEWLSQFEIEINKIDHICEIIKDISFKGAKVDQKMRTIEGMIVQDADRLDALGAIGIARAFAYGGKKDREIYNPNIKPILHRSFEEYKKNNSSTINHFYEKLLLLKDRMNTNTGKKIAEKRHKFMEDYLARFYLEFNGEDLNQ